MTIQVTGRPELDQQLTENPFALLTAMLLDQQVSMEKAFEGPWVITRRLAESGANFDPATVAEFDPEDFATLCSRKPAVHRFPGAMAKRIQTLAEVVLRDYGGDAGRVWADPGDANEVLARIRRLPGFGEGKAKIFLALIGKQLRIRPVGWEDAVGAYGDPDAYQSVADVTDAESLAKVRAYKKEQKAAAKGGAGAVRKSTPGSS